MPTFTLLLYLKQHKFNYSTVLLKRQINIYSSFLRYDFGRKLLQETQSQVGVETSNKFCLPGGLPKKKLQTIFAFLSCG